MKYIATLFRTWWPFLILKVRCLFTTRKLQSAPFLFKNKYLRPRIIFHKMKKTWGEGGIPSPLHSIKALLSQSFEYFFLILFMLLLTSKQAYSKFINIYVNTLFHHHKPYSISFLGEIIIDSILHEHSPKKEFQYQGPSELQTGNYRDSWRLRC